MKPPKNLGVSARDRLTRMARENRENAQLLMTRYAIERVLYRLGVSRHRERFILKGAMLFSVWTPLPYRATGDLDLLGYGDSAPDALAAIFSEILATAVEDDGVLFKLETLRVEPAREEDEYSGARLNLVAELAGARLPIKIDIGFGDIITPGPLEIVFPSLLNLPSPTLRAYPPETVVAEKFQAMVALGAINTRMKDFFDLWAMAVGFEFDGEVLSEAIAATFTRRETPIPMEPPIALSADFAKEKQAQWLAFLKRTEIASAPDSLAEAQKRISAFLMPPVLAIARAQSFKLRWRLGRGWSERY